MRYPSLTLLLLLLAVACFVPRSSKAWIWGKGKRSSKQKEEEEEELQEGSRRGGRAVLEIMSSSSSSREELMSASSLMQKAQSMVIGGGYGDGGIEESKVSATCWQEAYKKLVSSCSGILKDEERKCRLAYHFTHCFLRMSGWPPPPPCPDHVPVRSCTQKLDHHTHELYLAFFVESDALCHRLQGEAFRQETVDVVNDLKETGQWVLERVKQVERLSHQILSDALRQSKQLSEKLSAMESLSQELLEQNQELGGQVKETMGTVEAVQKQAAAIAEKQAELRDLHQRMEMVMASRLQELQEAATQTQRQLEDISQGNKDLAEQQVMLADSLAANIGRLKESAMQNLYELKQTQAAAMEETRLSLQGLSAEAQTAQAAFDIWRIEMDGRNNLLLKDMEAMHSAQEAFVSKQSSVLSILDRMFSLYDSILYESRALKLFLFYGTSVVFVHVLTSSKQINDARVPLYAGMFVSMGVELYIMKAYGSVLNTQQWIQTRCYWTRAFFGLFTAIIVLYFIITYRDISWENYVLLLELDRKLGSILGQSSATSVEEEEEEEDVQWEPHHLTEAEVSSEEAGPCGTPSWKTRLHSGVASSPSSKIISRAKISFNGGTENRDVQGVNVRKSCESEGDVFVAWMIGHGLDSSCLDPGEEGDGNDPDYECQINEQEFTYREYELRSLCKNRSPMRCCF